ncbi:diguanylate cyclase [Glaciecola sp. MH2013]|uniref:GGDEF domain-containing response regulator n=1 Tax=Glaciecola sp. MH2013 TaxID=2785524 RepID=UPI00189F890F|nr:response regulator [Glaciecola sp. MH2013]MBF7074330.1 diguanylate cyclase [Glaciecola sp. MH2013]
MPTNFDAKFKTKLKILVSLWADARKQKSLALLEPFRYNINAMAQSVATFALFELQSILQDINKACEDAKAEKLTIKESIVGIDALMNRLISDANKDPNPLLIENDNPFELLTSLDANKSAAKQSRKPSIAIIDDDKSASMAIASLIEEFNFQVDYYESIKVFKAAISDLDMQPDLVMLDITMPEITMEQVFDYAKQLTQRGIKVVSYSGQFSLETRLAAVRAGVVDFIVKPMAILGIIEKINRVLHLQKTRAYRVLFIDDNQSMGEFYQTLLEEAECEVYFSSSVEHMFDNLDDFYPDLFLLDMNMPDVNGLEVAKLIRQQKEYDFTPIVFLTADEQLETKLAALNSGADDVIAKSTPPGLVVKQLLTRLSRALAVKDFVSKDTLTGVLNHGEIMEAAMNSYRLSQRQKSPVSLAMLDLDHFKAVNDTFGHAAGDKVLSGLGQLLKRSLRTTDYIGRYGGEEFLLVFVGSTTEDAAAKLNHIREAFELIEFEAKSQKFRCTFSAGLIDLGNNMSLPHAVNQADQALYLSKEAGRNTVTIYEEKAL